MNWIDERTEELGAYIDQGLSAAEAASRFGPDVTREAVIGAAHRKGWRFGQARPKTSLVTLDDALSLAAEPPAVEDLAVSLLNQHRIVQKALPVMLDRVNDDPDLRAQVMARLIEGECRRVLEASIHLKHQAEKRRTGGGPLGAARSADMTAWAGAVQNALLDGFKLPGGTILGDATRSDLAEAMSSYQTVATDAAVKHRWLRLVLQSVPTGKRVRDALTEERLAELRQEARKVDA